MTWEFIGMLKRGFDLFATLCAAPLWIPVLGAAALGVRIFLGRPVLFIQQRPGFHEKPFGMFKLRTMTDAKDADGKLLPDSERLTKFGAFLRSTSLDELPELLNVLKGDMSLVGPRPLLMEYVDLYSPEQARRHEVRPGLTGWAQIHGRNDTTWEERLARDVWYVDHRSFLLDLRILFRTFFYVQVGTGINAPGHVTMPPFRGPDSKDNAPHDP